MQIQFEQNEYTDFLALQGHDIQSPLDVPLHCKLDIDLSQWYDFMQENWDNCFHVFYEPRPILTAASNREMELAQRVGYHSGNTVKRDWGKEPDIDALFKEFLGAENFRRMGIDPDTTLVRLLCYMPGNIFPVHTDLFEGWRDKFNIHDPDVMPTRFSVLLNKYSWGQYLQVHNKMITMWEPGDTYIIPNNVLHCSGNGGVVPKITLTVTGLMH